MKIPSQKIDAWLEAPSEDIHVFLLYGYEESLAEYRAYQLGRGLQKKHQCSMTTLEKIPSVGSLRDQICQPSLLPESMGGLPVIMLKNAKDAQRKAIVAVLNAKGGGYLIITAGALRGSSSLRTSVERHPRGAAIPCYADTPESLGVFIKKILAQADRDFQDDALNWLKHHLGSHRGIVHQEIKTLLLTFSDLPKDDAITLAHVQQCLQSQRAFFLEDIAQSAMSGNMQLMEDGVASILHEKIPPDRLLGVLITRMTTVLSIQAKGEHLGWERMRPPVHFSRRGAYRKDSQLWNKTSLITTASSLQKTQGACRLSPDEGVLLCRSALLEVAQKARMLLRG